MAMINDYVDNCGLGACTSFFCPGNFSKLNKFVETKKMKLSNKKLDLELPP